MLSAMIKASEPSLYLAGPGVFRPDAQAHAEALRAACRRAGARGLFPGDNFDDPSSPCARAIYRFNAALIDEADAVVADCSPFRGPSVDPGTAWEMGYASALGKPVFAYTSAGAASTYLERVRARDPATRRGPTDGNHADGDGLFVEDFGLFDNLMIACSVAGPYPSAEGAIAAAAAALRERGRAEQGVLSPRPVRIRPGPLVRPARAIPVGAEN